MSQQLEYKTMTFLILKCNNWGMNTTFRVIISGNFFESKTYYYLIKWEIKLISTLLRENFYKNSHILQNLKAFCFKG
jgi:hypothetical protein